MSHYRCWSALLLLVPTLLARAEDTPAAALAPFIESHSLAGAVTLVANPDKILSLETAGYADVAAKKPMQADSLFWIASMSKPITGLALMILVDEGKLSLDDPVEKHLPEFKDLWVIAEQDKEHQLLHRPSHPLTVREIMSHTSGLAFSSKMEQPTLDNLPLRDAVRSYTQMPLLHQPGSKYQYSNAGINTGGRLIEVLSGMPYEQFLDQRLFAPLGMKDTTFWPDEKQLLRLANAYKPDAAKTDLEETKISQLQYPLNRREGRYPMPGGGLFSTATDLAALCRMVARGGELDGKRYLSESAIKQMTSKQTPEALKDGYGVGWSTSGKSFGHGGALATNMNIDTERNLITIYLVQHSGFPGEGGEAHGAFKQAAERLFATKP